jgi:hypothetical protein
MAQSIRVGHTFTERNIAVAILAAWFLLAVAASLLGIFNSEPHPPIMLGLAVVMPVMMYGFCYFAFVGFRQFVASLDLRILTVAQTWRVLGFVFLLLYFRGLLPGVFAMPAGCGDIAIGITAPFVAKYWRRPYPYRTFMAWNLLGLIDLITAVTLGILASGTSVGLLSGEVTTRVMGLFPMSLIPTFFVPLFMIFHLISLNRAGKRLP